MLYQKVRPTILNEFIGNEVTIKALQRAIEAEEHAHVYIFKGPSGCGKTTLARILAKAFGCFDFNVIEKNAASDRGIDMARDLERYSSATPMGGGNRAVILDEAHALTKDAQGALLKVLEDVPEYAYYFLCTTDPQKLLPTIRTRCETVEVGKLPDDKMFELLLDAAEKAKIPDPGDDVMNEIIGNAEGCPRSALVMLEKQNGLGQEDALEAVQSFTTQEKNVIDLCRILLKGTWKELASAYNKLDDKDPEKIRRAVSGYLKSCLLKSKTPGEAGRFVSMIEEFTEPTYNSGEAGLLAMLYQGQRVGK